MSNHCKNFQRLSMQILPIISKSVNKQKMVSEQLGVKISATARYQKGKFLGTLHTVQGFLVFLISCWLVGWLRKRGGGGVGWGYIQYSFVNQNILLPSTFVELSSSGLTKQDIVTMCVSLFTVHEQALSKYSRLSKKKEYETKACIDSTEELHKARRKTLKVYPAMFISQIWSMIVKF